MRVYTASCDCGWTGGPYRTPADAHYVLSGHVCPLEPRPAADAVDLDADAGTWADAALCAQTDPEAFFPDKGGAGGAARAVCGRCPVAAPCLAWALEHDLDHGIYGGLAPRERRRLRRAS